MFKILEFGFLGLGLIFFVLGLLALRSKEKVSYVPEARDRIYDRLNVTADERVSSEHAQQLGRSKFQKPEFIEESQPRNAVYQEFSAAKSSPMPDDYHTSRLNDAEDYHTSRLNESEDYHTSRLSDEDDHHTSRLNETEDYHTSRLNDAEDYHTSRLSNEEDYHTSRLNEAKDYHTARLDSDEDYHTSRLSEEPLVDDGIYNSWDEVSAMTNLYEQDSTSRLEETARLQKKSSKLNEQELLSLHNQWDE